MARVLAVAHRTVDRRPLFSALAERAAAGDDIFILVPASAPSAAEAALSASEHLRRWPGERPAVSVARWRLDGAVRQVAGMGVTVNGDVGVADPVEAVAQTLAWRTFDAIVLSTSSHPVARLVALDVARRLRRRFDLPVHHVDSRTSPPAPAVEPA